MSWFDFLLMAFLASLIALGIKRQMSGFLVGLGAILIFRVLLGISTGSISWLAVGFALIAGLILGLFGMRLNGNLKIPEVLKNTLGGVGGALLGILMLLVIVTSLPIEKNINDQIVYPSQKIPSTIRSAIQDSYFVDIGRNILLYPIIEKSNFNAQSAKIYKVLHQFIVVGKPWEKEL